jgi:CRP-like cAMP-binding protein
MGEQLLKAKERIVRNGIMDRVECFKDLSKDQKLKLIDVMRRVVHQKGTYICKQNDIGTTLHIIIQGEVQVTINNRSEANGEKKIVTLGQVVFVDVLVSKLCCF